MTQETLNYSIDKNGLQVPSLQDHINWLIAQFKSIYGEDINVNSDTPDGQLINILAQSQSDIDEMIIGIYNGLNIALAEGIELDNLATIHGIKRRGGSYTILPITLTFTQLNVSLQGLDNDFNVVESSNAFTVADNNGNQFYLISSYTSNEIGEVILDFRAKNIGNVTVNLESITNIITPQVGVVAVSNNSAAVSIGTEEESDRDLKARFLKTYGNGGQGAWENIVGALYNVEGVINVQGENNPYDTTSEHGTPPHSVWLIVQGGNNQDIAEAIYRTISAGVGMRGEQSYIVTDLYDNQNVIKWDVPSYENLYIKFTIVPKSSTTTIDTDFIKETLINTLSLKMNESVDINTINSILYGIQNDIIYKDTQLSVDGTNWEDIVTNTNLNYIFVLNAQNITITEE